MTPNQILAGLGLIVVLAVVSQLLASLLRIPALIVLLPIDPVGGILGALVFHGVVSSTREGLGAQLGQFAASAAVGLLGGAVGAALLWTLLGHLRLGDVLGTTVQLAAAVGVAAACDAVRDDTGLIAAVVMGMALANLPGLDLPVRRPFFETLVSLIIGLLFISISATVTRASLRHLILPSHQATPQAGEIAILLGPASAPPPG